MPHQITITVSDEVYQGLQSVKGTRTISQFFEDLARPVVTGPGLEAFYRDMALDLEREQEASEWVEAGPDLFSAGERLRA